MKTTIEVELNSISDIGKDLWLTPKYEENEIVKHIASDGLYQILEEPREMDRLENSGESFYKYVGLNSEITWTRSRSEMEDGRFVSVGSVCVNY